MLFSIFSHLHSYYCLKFFSETLHQDENLNINNFLLNKNIKLQLIQKLFKKIMQL